MITHNAKLRKLPFITPSGLRDMALVRAYTFEEGHTHPVRYRKDRKEAEICQEKLSFPFASIISVNRALSGHPGLTRGHSRFRHGLET